MIAYRKGAAAGCVLDARDWFGIALNAAVCSASQNARRISALGSSQMQRNELMCRITRVTVTKE
jgi:hypothetical protein